MATDANAFVAQESEDSTSYSVRVAACDLLDVLLDRQPSRVLPAIQANLEAVVQQSSAQADEWWRPLEAAFAAFPSLSQVRRERIQLHVRFLNPDLDAQSLVEVAVSPDAWSELVSGVDRDVLRRA